MEKPLVILITGGTGTLGRALATRILARDPTAIIRIFSRDEWKQDEMAKAFAAHASRLRFLVGDVRDKDRLRRALRGVDRVYHAAAMKQVPACEYNPNEAILTNVVGAQNVIEAALDNQVPRVLAVSTDKAVNPVNLYGATKLCAEKLFVQANSYRGAVTPTLFAVVRYGNVVGSRGSVIPLFVEQRKSGKITITDPRMTRFWITIEAAVEFVTGCMELLRGGEVFIPRIPSMKITDLARAVAPEARIETVGIRPGEKLHECLLTEDESRTAFEVDSRYEIHPQFPWWTSPPLVGGRKVAEGFRYASDTNKDWLDAEKLRSMVAGMLGGP